MPKKLEVEKDKNLRELNQRIVKEITEERGNAASLKSNLETTEEAKKNLEDELQAHNQQINYWMKN